MGSFNIGYLADPVSGGLKTFYDKEKKAESEAFKRAQMSPQERELADKIKALVQTAIKDRQATREHVLNQMGLKTVINPDGSKKVGRLTDEERRGLQDPMEQNRSEMAKTYAKRAMAAFEGKTELPTFIKKDLDVQKEQEATALKSIMGDEFATSAAGQQAVEQLKKREEAARFNVQEQDRAVALNASNQMTSLNQAATGDRIAKTNTLSNYAAPVINSASGLLDYRQGKRNSDLQVELDRLAAKRQGVTQWLTVGGLLGGSAMGNAFGNSGGRTDVQTTPQFQTTSFGMNNDARILPSVTQEYSA